MNTLIAELKKDIYSGLSASDALALLPAQLIKTGRIQGFDKLDLVTLIITNEIDDRLLFAASQTNEQLNMVENPDLADAYRSLAKILSKALDVDLIKADLYRINLGLPNIRGMLDGALTFGLLTESEHATMLKLAEYKEGTDFSGYKLTDVVQARAELLLMVKEVYILPNSTEQKVYILTIAKDAPKKISIKIMQRFGDNVNDLTPWHEAVSFVNVLYKQKEYKAQIGSCTAAYRELKVVSEYALDMSIV